jgi:LacI family gluconate utilization system Gnt-I transcriptional repressor
MDAGAEQECLRRGWKVPERIAIAGFDDQEIAAEAVPALTTVRIAREEIGCVAAQMLLDRLHGKTVDPNELVAAYQPSELCSEDGCGHGRIVGDEGARLLACA